MAKLYFRYGTVGSAKTMNLLAVAHNYQLQGKKVILIKPKLDQRFGDEVIQSRAGLVMDADILVAEDSTIDVEAVKDAHCILVDEVQFLSPHLINQFSNITRTLDIPVICYGLRTDFTTKLFPGAARMLELADSIEEIKTTCHFCNRKATFNLKHNGHRATLEGDQIDIGCEEKYLPTCTTCYFREVGIDDACVMTDRSQPQRSSDEAPGAGHH